VRRNNKKILAAVAAVSSLSAFNAVHAGTVIIGNWEQAPGYVNGTLPVNQDGWIDWGSAGSQTTSSPAPPPFPSYPGDQEYFATNTVGNTLGNYSLVVSPGNGYVQSLSNKLEYTKDGNGNSEEADFASGDDEFSIDETEIASEWTGGSYALTQLNVYCANSSGTYMAFGLGFPVTDTRNPGFPGGYTAYNGTAGSGYQGTTTATMTWNLSSVLAYTGPNPQFVELNFDTITNYATTGNYYFDNARLFNLLTVTATWSAGQGDNNWTSNNNWSNNGDQLNAGGTAVTTPGGMNGGDNVTFGPNSVGVPTTITLNAPETVGVLNFNSGNSFTIAAGTQGTLGAGTGGSLTFNNGTPASPQINDSFGNHYISAPVILAQTVTVAVGQSSNTMTISGNISGAGGITVAGTNTVSPSVGTVALSGVNTNTGPTSVNSGTLVILPTGVANTVALPNTTLTIGTTGAGATDGTVILADNAGQSSPANLANQLLKVPVLTIDTGSVLDIRNNHLNIADPGGTPDDGTYTAILGEIKNGIYNGHPGYTSAPGGTIISSEGLVSPNYGVGLVDGNDGVHNTLVSANEIEVAYTLEGDANLDGKVDASDFSIFAPNFGLNTTLGWEGGDFNYDGKVDASDFSAFAPNFGLQDNGTAIGLPSADYVALDAFAAANGLTFNPVSVPEPASLGLLTLGAVGILSRRRRSSERSST
jgi:autotransporter-associated beta strand protein